MSPPAEPKGLQWQEEYRVVVVPVELQLAEEEAAPGRSLLAVAVPEGEAPHPLLLVEELL